MTDTPQDLRDKIRTLLSPLNAGRVSSDIRPRQSSRSRSPRAQGKDYAAGKSSRQQHQDFTEAELSGDQNNHGFRRLPRFPWVQDPNRAPKQRAPALDTPHRDELKRPPTVGLEGPDLQDRFRAYHRRAVYACAESNQLVTVRDVVVLGPWRVKKERAATDMTLLAEGFTRDNARGLYGALRGMNTSMSACHRGGTTRMRGWELEVESSMVDESSRRSRAVCRFDSETLNHEHEAQFRVLTITSSWRTSRANAEMDLNAIQSAFSQGGLEAALRSAAPKDATAAATRASA